MFDKEKKTCKTFEDWKLLNLSNLMYQKRTDKNVKKKRTATEMCLTLPTGKVWP